MDDQLLAVIKIWKDKLTATRTYLEAIAQLDCIKINDQLNTELKNRNMTWADIQHLLHT